jgi:predicted dinucleotide-binding enzyme
VRAATVAEAAAFGDAVLVAIPMGKYQSLPADALIGKIVMDAMNYYPQRDGQMDFGGRTSSEGVARYLDRSRVVKAFNTMHFQMLASEGRKDAPVEERLAIFIAGDDAGAKATVARLIEDIGFAPVDTGSLAASVVQEPGAAIYARRMTGWEARQALASGA